MPLKDKNLKSLYNQKTAWLRKRKLIELLGGGCEVCGDTNFKHLEFDHRAGDGADELRKYGNSNAYAKISRWLLDKDVKKRIACLCANCHAEKTFNTDGHSSASRKYSRLSISEIESLMQQNTADGSGILGRETPRRNPLVTS
jgi:hypothetical protein